MRDDKASSSANNAIIERLRRFYDNFDDDAMAQLGELYHADVTFIDPVHQVQGLQALQDYFRHTMQGVDKCQFDFSIEAQNGRHAFVQWDMRLQHPKLAGGHEIVVPGVSHLEFDDDKIILQRDYYDMGAMVYEHVPVMRFLTRKVKQRLVPA